MTTTSSSLSTTKEVFVPEYRERSFHRGSAITKVMYHVHRKWGRDITSDWIFGTTADGSLVREKIEFGEAVESRPLWTMSNLESTLSWFTGPAEYKLLPVGK